jgi:hypothetical protein
LQGDETEKPAYVSDLSAKLEAGNKDEVLNQIATDSPILLIAPVKGMYIYRFTLLFFEFPQQSDSLNFKRYCLFTHTFWDL